MEEPWSVALLLVETAMNLLFIPFSFILGFICFSQKKYHVNFRTLLQMANIGNFLMNAQRMVVVATRLLTESPSLDINGSSNSSNITESSQSTDDPLLVSFLLAMLVAHLFATFLYMLSWTALSLERVMATYNFRKYEQFGISKAFWIVGVLFLTVFLFLMVVSRIVSQQASSLFVALVHAFLVIFMVILLPLILRLNRKFYASRHTEEMNVGSRYQLDENIRATRYLLPAATIVVVSKVLHCFLMGYSVLFTDVPLGTDTSALGHVYDLLSSSTRLLSTGWLVLANEKLRLRWSRRRSSVAPTNAKIVGDHYFQELQNMWNMDQLPL